MFTGYRNCVRVHISRAEKVIEVPAYMIKSGGSDSEVLGRGLDNPPPL